jgi:ubiquinone/menaquinone biosynthesis C-methylase UbiE
MKNSRAEMLNKKASDPKAKPDRIIESLKIKTNDIIADIGAGGGYYALRFAEIVGKQGKVYAIDSNPDMLKIINDESKRAKLNNIITMNANEMKSVLLQSELDLIFVRNTYHHLENRINYFADLKNYLKPNSRIAVIEYKPAGSIFSFHRLHGHQVKPKIIISEMQQAGYKVLESFDFLKEQSFTIFST